MGITQLFTTAGRVELFNQKMFDSIRIKLGKMYKDLVEMDKVIQAVEDVKQQNPDKPEHRLPIKEDKLRAYREIEEDDFAPVGHRLLGTFDDKEVIEELRILYNKKQYSGKEIFGHAPFDYKNDMLESYIIAAKRSTDPSHLSKIVEDLKEGRNIQLLKAYLMSDPDMREKVADATIELLKKLQHPETGRLKDADDSIHSNNNLRLLELNEGIIDMLRLSEPETTARLAAAILNGLTQEEADEFLEKTYHIKCLERSDELYAAFLKHTPEHAELLMQHCEGMDPIRRYQTKSSVTGPYVDKPSDLGLS